MMLKFNVKNQIIARTDAFRVVADSRNYLTARFTFTEEWKGNIIAVFGNGEEYYNVVLSENACVVPWEVIKPPFFTVSVFCSEESLVTANVLTVEVEKSGMEEGEAPTPPTPDVWQQYMASMQEAIDKGVPYIGENGNWYVWDGEAETCVDTGVPASGGQSYIDWEQPQCVQNKPPINKGGSETAIIEGKNTHAISVNTHAEGANTIAGGKGFKIIAMSEAIINEDGTVTGTYTLSSTDGLEKDMMYSVRLKGARYNAGTILKIDGLNVTVENYAGLGDELETDVDDPENYSVENYFTIVGRPDLGDIEVGFNAHAEGEDCIAQDRAAHTEGLRNKSIGSYSHTEGRDNIAGYSAHAEGRGNLATGNASHAEGGYTNATKLSAHAEGNRTEATAEYAHAEGSYTQATGQATHAEGEYTLASARDAHAEGHLTTAARLAAHAEGYGTIAEGLYQHVQGIYNLPDRDKYIHIVGNGNSDSERSNAHTLDKKGNGWFAGSVETTAIILKSSTEGSNKRFKITVDDAGTLSVEGIV